MYAGRVMECSDVFSIFEKPKHPYTQALLKSIPKMEKARTQLSYIPGSVPDLTGEVPACPFYGRCQYARTICAETEPKVEEMGIECYVACHF